jgi:hypothetical protein
MKYAEYAQYNKKYEEYVHCAVAVSHCDVLNMRNMEYDSAICRICNLICRICNKIC